MKTPRQRSHEHPRLYAALGVMTNDQLQAVYEATWQRIGVLAAPHRHHRRSCPHIASGCAGWWESYRQSKVNWALLELDTALHDVANTRGQYLTLVPYTPSYLAMERVA